MTDTGASREDISRALYTLRLVNRGGPDGASEALKILDNMRAGIAKRLGVEVPGVDLLADYPDLAKAVENAEMTREHALEIAGGRRIRFETNEAQRRANDDSQRQAQVQQQRDNAFKELDTLGDELGKTDVEYDAKFALLKSNGDIQDIVQNFPPAKWADQFRRRYNLLGKAGGVKQRTAKPAHQPLRSSGTGGGGNAAPKSLLDAVMQGVESADD